MQQIISLELMIFNETFEKISFTVVTGEKAKRTTTSLTNNPLVSPLKFLKYKGEKFFLLVCQKIPGCLLNEV